MKAEADPRRVDGPPRIGRGSGKLYAGAPGQGGWKQDPRLRRFGPGLAEALRLRAAKANTTV